jgi:hypothetical protein
MSFYNVSPCLYITWGMNSRPVNGRSSEISTWIKKICSCSIENRTKENKNLWWKEVRTKYIYGEYSRVQYGGKWTTGQFTSGWKYANESGEVLIQSSTSTVREIPSFYGTGRSIIMFIKSPPLDTYWSSSVHTHILKHALVAPLLSSNWIYSVRWANRFCYCPWYLHFNMLTLVCFIFYL